MHNYSNQEFVSKWTETLCQENTQTIATRIWQQRWNSEEYDPEVSGLPKQAANFSWAEHVEMFFLSSNDKDANVNVLRAQNNLRKAIIDAFEKHCDNDLETDDVWLSDVLSLRWGRRKQSENEKLPSNKCLELEYKLSEQSFETICKGISVITRFNPQIDEDDYRFQKNIAQMILRTIGKEAYSEDYVVSLTKYLGTYFTASDCHLFRWNAFANYDEINNSDTTKATILDERSMLVEETIENLKDWLLRASPELGKHLENGPLRLENAEEKIKLVEDLNGRFERILDIPILEALYLSHHLCMDRAKAVKLGAQIDFFHTLIADLGNLDAAVGSIAGKFGNSISVSLQNQITKAGPSSVQEAKERSEFDNYFFIMLLGNGQPISRKSVGG